MNKYHNKHYMCSCLSGCDNLSVKKTTSGEWVDIEMVINGFDGGRIQLRSREAAEQLRFMLGQLLGGEE